MEILQQQTAEVLEMRLKGRLDAYWADHLSNAVTAAIREGARHIQLNFSEVGYISSAGIRVLLSLYSALKEIHGTLGVISPSEQVKSVLEMTGLTVILSTQTQTFAPSPQRAKDIVQAGVRIQLYEQAQGEILQCKLIGDPELLPGCGFTKESSAHLSFGPSMFAVGVGAFGHGYEDSKNRFGEFLAVSGAVTYLPTDGTNVPDYLLSTGSYAPEMQVLYGLFCEGKFSRHIRFESDKNQDFISLSRLAELVLEIAEADTAGVVIIGETAGLVGVALTRSPASEAPGTAPFHFPETREWFSFTSERAFARSLSLITGIVSKQPQAGLEKFLRPINGSGSVHAHLHAAAFSYRPLRSGEIDVKETVERLFEAETVQGVLHLINDDRKIGGAGESELIRGACWLGPVRVTDA